MAQDTVRDLLRKERRAMSITEISTATQLDYRTVCKNVQDMGKWRELDVTYGTYGKKMVKLKDQK